MKRLVLLLLAVIGVSFARWSQVRIELPGRMIPVEITSYDVLDLQPGISADMVVDEAGMNYLEDLGISYRVEIPDLEEYYSSQMSSASGFGDYYTFSEAMDILDALHAEYPEIISERIILPNDASDETFLGNHVYAVKISDNVEEEEDEPEVLFNGCHHAREPISVYVCVEWARWLCQNYGTDPVATHLVNNRQIWILPVLNPDGYLYNEENFPQGGGMHRKNRKPTDPTNTNSGVDINRNYTYMWGLDDIGSSPDPAHDAYRGPYAGSEEETQSIMNLCKEHNFMLAINFHCPSNLFIFPWGYLPHMCEDSLAFLGWGEIATRACHYAVTPGAGLYALNGNAGDWMYGETEVKNRIFGVTVEVGEAFWQESEIAQHHAETHPLLIATAKAAGTYPELEAYRISDGGDGIIEAGETVDLTVWVRNMSVQDESGEVTLTLDASDPRIQTTQRSVSIEPLAPQQIGSNLAHPLGITLAPTAQPDSAIPLTLTVMMGNEEVAYDLVLPVGAAETLLSDDFDASTGAGWTTEWGRTTEHFHSSPNSMTDSPYQESPQGINWMESPEMNLEEMVTANLTFWHRYSIQPYHQARQGQDWGVLEITHDGLDDWVTLRRYNGYIPDWQEQVFNLDAYCGSTGFAVRFGVVVDDTLNLDGWYLDDVEIAGFTGALSNPVAVEERSDDIARFCRVNSVSRNHVRFSGSTGLDVEFQVYDPSGRQIARSEGTTPFVWEAADARGWKLEPGVYFIKYKVEGTSNTDKLIIVD